MFYHYFRFTTGNESNQVSEIFSYESDKTDMEIQVAPTLMLTHAIHSRVSIGSYNALYIHFTEPQERVLNAFPKRNAHF